MSEERDSTSTRSFQSEMMQHHKAHGLPVVVDLGKKSGKRIKELRRGEPGKALQEVYEAVDALKAQKAIAPDSQVVIVVVRKKTSRKNPFMNFG